VASRNELGWLTAGPGLHASDAETSDRRARTAVGSSRSGTARRGAVWRWRQGHAWAPTRSSLRQDAGGLAALRTDSRPAEVVGENGKPG
jgi:hypothetical protein